VERVRARTAGGALFVDLQATVSRTLPLDRVAGIKSRMEAAIRKELPHAEVTATIEPAALDDESVLERVMVIARNRALAVHHVTIHRVGERLVVSIDLEVDGRLSLAAAHDIASRLEAAIADELGSEIEIDTHIEPLQTDDISGHDASDARVGEVQQELSAIAARFGVLRNIHEVRVRQTDAGEIVNFHCQVDPTLSVADVHDRVDEVERGLRRRFPEIKRVIGHAEPAA
jgi:divalent metal cation (Fe/Co/Zn/Cd) transporter